MKNILFISCIALLMACSNDDDSVDCSTVLPPPNWFQISFVNSQGEPLLGSQFVKDSFKLASNNQVIYLKPVPFSVEETLQIGYDVIESGTTYELELDENNMDRLRFDFTVIPGACGNDYTIDQVFYNDNSYQNPTPNSGIVTFERD